MIVNGYPNKTSEMIEKQIFIVKGIFA